MGQVWEEWAVPVGSSSHPWAGKAWKGTWPWWNLPSWKSESQGPTDVPSICQLLEHTADEERKADLEGHSDFRPQTHPPSILSTSISIIPKKTQVTINLPLTNIFQIYTLSWDFYKSEKLRESTGWWRLSEMEVNYKFIQHSCWATLAIMEPLMSSAVPGTKLTTDTHFSELLN